MKILKTFIIACFLILIGLAIGIINVIVIKHFANYTHDKAAIEVFIKGMLVYILQPFVAFSLFFIGIKTIAKNIQVK